MADLNAFIEALERRRQTASQDLNEHDFKEIARDLGWTDEELLEVEEQGKLHREKGQEFMLRGLFEDALREFQEASKLMPFDPLAKHSLAQASFGIWKKSKSSTDLHITRAYAQRAIEADPSIKIGFNVLEDIEALHRETPKKPAIVGVVVVLLSILTISVLVRVQTLESDAPDSQLPTQEPAAPVAPVPPPVPSAPTAPVPPPAPESVQKEDNLLRVEFESEEFELQIVDAQLNHYGEKSFIRLAFKLKNVSELEFSKIDAVLEIFDKEQNVVGVRQMRMLSEFKFPLRSNDLVEYVAVENAPTQAESARITIESTKSQRSPKYKESKDLEVVWRLTQPEGVDLKIRERAVKAQRYGRLISVNHAAILEIENSGTKSITKLGVQNAYFDKETRLNTSRVKSFETPLEPGETRILFVRGMVDSLKPTYQPEVVEIHAQDAPAHESDSQF